MKRYRNIPKFRIHLLELNNLCKQGICILWSFASPTKCEERVGDDIQNSTYITMFDGIFQLAEVQTVTVEETDIFK